MVLKLLRKLGVKPQRMGVDAIRIAVNAIRSDADATTKFDKLRGKGYVFRI